ncbi:phosphotransferase enzyme family protein [Cuneatibacter caecimuris]|uniref:Phosphotransferase family enzyme n=1 Tax=Cuneatibacter caecimuris TaxID=1796618 RepID=A0A4V2F5Y5_9FIRM|nr:phosphotransferase [Cuneatibacter caecimuris]RZS94439.1 phosphotransferase family enzyme [Cuneatibacter caecimuris]
MDIEIQLVMRKAEQLYNIKLLHRIHMGGSGNIIFAAESGQRPYILRVSKGGGSSLAHIDFELNWVEYLSLRMEGIVQPIRSVNNRLYEVIESDGGAYVLCLMKKAEGKLVDCNNPAEFNEVLFSNLGALMGRIHKLTADYEGNRPCPEFQWNGPYFWRRDIAIPDELVRQGEKRFLKEINALPAAKENYGIIHFDIHTDNFFMKNTKITLFDFFDCQYNWYAADIASAMFFMVQRGAGPLKHLSEKERTAFAESYLISYLQGYLQSNYISKYWICTIDLFMKYQMVDEYVAASNYWPEEDTHLQQRYLDWHRERIAHNQPYVYIDYDNVLDRLPKVPFI